MVVDDLGVIGVTVLEAKTQTPLIVYPNAPLPAPVSLRTSNLFAGGMRMSSIRRAMSSI